MDANEVRSEWSSTLDRARTGDRIVVYRYGKAVAAVVPVDDLLALRLIEYRHARMADAHGVSIDAALEAVRAGIYPEK